MVREEAARKPELERRPAPALGRRGTAINVLLTGHKAWFAPRVEEYRQYAQGVFATRWHDDFARASGGIGHDGAGVETAGTVPLL